MALVDAYLTHLAAERGLSAHTISNYAREVRLLLDNSGAIALADLRAHDIRRIIATLHARGLSGRSLARTLSAWRGFYHYLDKRHGYTHNPCEGLRAPKHARTLPRSLSVEQVAHLLDSPDDSALAVRDNAIFELFYSSGLRLTELATLKLTQLDLIQGEVNVTGKGNKSRLIPLGGHAITALRRWFAQRTDTGDYVFPGRNGKHLSQRAIELRLKHRAEQIGLDTKVHPHVLRHAFASHLLQSSGDLRAVQELLGHASISSTQIYTQLDFQHLAATYDQAHPRARKKS
ncbi:tyrosine recombinase XerC [Sulfuriferula sp. AH1]|nr:tyrosine recombinase XerC [Sulfuriferula sp. AH1]ARU32788.1 tyrosine recombinase XerC [Sulfuriferula sp. AH1]